MLNFSGRNRITNVGLEKKRLSMSVLALAISSLLSHNAMAQDNQTSEQPNAEKDYERIEVKGIRASLNRAQNIKRYSGSNVEAVTLEDLGEFTDVSLADALQRVPGVQIQRNDNGATDGGDRVSIRGLGPQFVKTTVNGRTPLSGGTEGVTNLREFNFEVLPPEITNGLVVYKSPEARLVENGLGGMVDVKTIRPLDAVYQDGNTINIINVRGTYNNLSEEIGPRFSGISVFKNEAETFGAFLSVLYQEQDNFVEEVFYRTAERDLVIDTNGNGVNDSATGEDEVLEGIVTPSNVTNNPIASTNERFAFAGGLQFETEQDIEINVDAMYSRLNGNSRRDVFRQHFGLGGGIYDGVFEEGSIVVEDEMLQYVDGAGLVDDEDSIALQTQDLMYDNEQESLMLGLNVAWENDDWDIEFDYSYSELEFVNNIRVLGNFLAFENGFGSGTLNPELGDFVFDDLSSQAPSLTFADNSVIADSSAYGAGGFFLNQFQNDSDRHAFRLDATYALNDSYDLKFGARYQQTNLDVRSGRLGVNRPESVSDDDLRAAAFGDLREPFLSDVLPSGVGNVWSDINGNAVAALIPELFTVSAVGTSIFNNGNIVDAVANPPENVTGQADNFFQTEESSLAAYLQLNYSDEINDFPVRANFGLRVVQTDVDSTAFSAVTIDGRGLDVNDLDQDGDTNEQLDPVNATFIPTMAKSDDFQVLPAINVNIELEEDTQLRFGLAKTVTRPTYRDQVPNNAVSINIEEGFSSASGGNGQLSPYTSWGLDITLEHYTDNDGALYASLFFKEVDDFIGGSDPDTADGNDEIALPFDPSDAESVANAIQLGNNFDVNSGLYTVDSAAYPLNTSSAEAMGLELGFNQPLSFLPEPFNNFGISGNYTYIDSSFDEDVGDAGFGFPGASQNNINFVGYYEVEDFSVRLAYTFRDEYLRSLAGVGDRRDAAFFTEGQQQLNLNIAYSVTEDLKLTLAATNLTNEVRRDFRGTEGNFQAYVTRPRTYVFGARYSF